MGSQRVGHDWATDLIWSDLIFKVFTEFVTYCFCCVFWLLATRRVASQLPNQGVSRHPFHWKVKSTAGPPEKSLKWVFYHSVGVWEGCAVLSHFSCVQLFVTSWTAALQAPLSWGFLRQEYWRWLPFPTPGDLPSPGIKPRSPVLADRFFTIKPPGQPLGKGVESVFTCSLGSQRVKHDLETKQLCLKEKSL